LSKKYFKKYMKCNLKNATMGTANQFTFVVSANVVKGWKFGA